MTHNQIDYWNLVENQRHNRAMEELNRTDVETRAGTLSEAIRHNIKQEDLSAASIAQQEEASRRAAEASRFASELGYSSSLYSADTSRYGYDLNAITQKYNTDVLAATQRYATETNSSTQRYSADLNYDASRYSADTSRYNTERTAEATERGQDINSGTQVLLEQYNAAQRWYNQNTNLGNWISKFNINLGGSNNEKRK